MTVVLAAGGCGSIQEFARAGAGAGETPCREANCRSTRF